MEENTQQTPEVSIEYFCIFLFNTLRHEVPFRVLQNIVQNTTVALASRFDREFKAFLVGCHTGAQSAPRGAPRNRDRSTVLGDARPYSQPAREASTLSTPSEQYPLGVPVTAKCTGDQTLLVTGRVQDPRQIVGDPGITVVRSAWRGALLRYLLALFAHVRCKVSADSQGHLLQPGVLRLSYSLVSDVSSGIEQVSFLRGSPIAEGALRQKAPRIFQLDMSGR